MSREHSLKPFPPEEEFSGETLEEAAALLVESLKNGKFKNTRGHYVIRVVSHQPSPELRTRRSEQPL
jgi:hypothetical protein